MVIGAVYVGNQVEFVEENMEDSGGTETKSQGHYIEEHQMEKIVGSFKKGEINFYFKRKLV